MPGDHNPRVLATPNPNVLRRELERLGASPERSIAMLNRLPCLPILLENVSPAAGAAVAAALEALGGAAAIGDAAEGAGRLLLLGNVAQFQALAARLPEGAPGTLAGAALGAVRSYYAPRGTTRIGGTAFVWGARTYVMGILNVTPDSFSGDGLGNDVAAAMVLAERQVAEGADIVDVGGESTRPHSERIDVADELRRVLPVVERLARGLPVPVSVDTYKAAVAERCLDAGAALVNDVWGLRADPAMAGLVARRKVPVILMHNQQGIAYRDLFGDVIRVLRESIALARQAGVAEEQIIVDPGIGFGKSKEQNLALLHRLEELKVLGRPLLLGTSRKSTIGYVLNLPPEERVEGTAATVALGIAQGVDMVRVHDVREMVRVCRMADAVVRWQPASEPVQHWPGQTG